MTMMTYFNGIGIGEEISSEPCYKTQYVIIYVSD